MTYISEDFKNNDKTKYLYPSYEDLLKKEIEAKELLNEDGDEGVNDEMRELANIELADLNLQKEKLLNEMSEILEKDKLEEEKPKAMILEIASGAGGDEASLFAAELALMYQNFALKNRMG
jgi:peptide chain release factor 1